MAFKQLIKRSKKIIDKVKKKPDFKKEKDTPDWMKGMSKKEIDEMLGKPTTDAEGVLRQRKKGGSVVKRKSSGSIGCGKAVRGQGKGPYKKKEM